MPVLMTTGSLPSLPLRQRGTECNDDLTYEDSYPYYDYATTLSERLQQYRKPEGGYPGNAGGGFGKRIV